MRVPLVTFRVRRGYFFYAARDADYHAAVRPKKVLHFQAYAKPAIDGPKRPPVIRKRAYAISLAYQTLLHEGLSVDVYDRAGPLRRIERYFQLIFWAADNAAYSQKTPKQAPAIQKRAYAIGFDVEDATVAGADSREEASTVQNNSTRPW